MGLLVAGCGGGGEESPPAAQTTPAAARSGPSGIPPPPPTEEQDLGPDQPPVIWVGGSITRVDPDRIELREGSGSVVALQRLGEGATAFFRVSGGTWQRTGTESPPRSGELACIEVLLDGPSFLALRVFLGAGCGPA